MSLSVESVPEVGNVGQPISMKLATEVGLGEKKKSRSGFVFCFLVPEFPGGGGGGGRGTTWRLQNMKKKKQHALTGVGLTLHENKQKHPVDLLIVWCVSITIWSFKSHMRIWQKIFWQCGAWHNFWTDIEEEAIISNCPVIEVYISCLPR